MAGSTFTNYGNLEMNEFMESPLMQMLEVTGLKPTVCSCKVCRKKCSQIMCLGTPDDILRLINAGFGNLLQEIQISVVLVNHREVMPIRMVQLMRDENGCAVFKDGMCLLHNMGLKPAEGRYFIHPEDHHDETIMDLLTLTIALEWSREENKTKVDHCFQKVVFG